MGGAPAVGRILSWPCPNTLSSVPPASLEDAMASLGELREQAKSYWENDPALLALEAIPDLSIRRAAYEKFVEG